MKTLTLRLFPLVLLPASLGLIGVPAGAQPGHWTSIGPTRINAPPIGDYGAYDAVGRLTTIAIHPNDSQIIYVGSVGQLGHEGCGVWKTTDGGQTWAAISDSLPTLSIGAIAIDPTCPERVYIVTADEGLYRSDDAGTSWLHLHGDLHIRSNTNEGDRTFLLIDPTAPNVLFLTSDDGVLRSSDGGLSWPQSLRAGRATSLVMDPLHPNVLYASILNKGIYKTTTGGAAGDKSWIQQTQAPLPHDNVPNGDILLGLSHPASEPSETVYALFPPIGGELDFYSTTDGSNWTKHVFCTHCAEEDPPCACSFLSLVANPSDSRIVQMGGPLLFVTEDGGVSFTQVPLNQNDRQPASPHGDYWELTTDPSDPSILFAGSDGGLFRSTDHGKEGTWTFIGEGITNAEMYDIALGATAGPLAISGTQDNGNIRYEGSTVWDHIPQDIDHIQGGDGGGVAIDQNDPDRFYAVFDNRGSPSVSTDGGESFSDFYFGLTSRETCAIWKMAFHIQTHPSNPDTVLASCEQLWRTTTASPSGDWAPIFSPSDEVVHSAVDANLNIYYAGTRRGSVYAGANGSGWTSVFSHPAQLNLTDLEVNPHDSNIVYASFATPAAVDRDCGTYGGPGRVYRLRRLSADLPDLSMESEDITADLPQGLCVNALASDPYLPRTLYAATNKGVYRGRSSLTGGGGWIWHSYNEGMPPADVRDLEVQAVTGHIFAATFGRSAFEVEPDALLTVNIDIKPGTSENPINPGSKGKIPVAILSSPDFDAPAELDLSTLTFGRTGNENSLAFCNPAGEDVNGDLLLDEVCHFYTLQTGFQPGDTEGILKGQTVEGVDIEGHDVVRIVPESAPLPGDDQALDGDSSGGWNFSLGTARPTVAGNVLIGFTLASEGQATLCVYDVSGRLVRTLLNGPQSAGFHEILWDGKNDHGQRLGAGVYFYRLIAGNRSSQKKLVILKG